MQEQNNIDMSLVKLNDTDYLFRNLSGAEVQMVMKIAAENPKYQRDLTEPIKQVLAEREDVKYLVDTYIQSHNPANEEEMARMMNIARDEAIIRTVINEEQVKLPTKEQPKVMVYQDNRKAGFADAIVLALISQVAIFFLLLGIVIVIK